MYPSMTLKEISQKVEVNNSLIPMRFTGFYDRKNKEIYEGDLIHLDASNFDYKVVFENGSFYCYHVKSLDGSRWGLLSRFYETTYPVEIIGNIYENKKLLQ